MTNTNIQGPIQISGRGQVTRPHGNFGPGEYSLLHNAEILEGKIIARRNIRHAYNSAISYSTRGIRFCGQVNGDTTYFVDPNNWHRGLRSTSSYPPEFEAPEIRGIPNVPPGGVFNYNNLNYRVFTTYTSWSGVIISLDIWTEGTLPSNTSATDYNSSTITVLTFPITSYRTIDLVHTICTNAMMFKDRLWLSWSHGVYFSKAGDPTKFATADGGGFFLFPDDTVRYCVSINDTVYVICDSRIYSITYNSDPNTDAVKRVLSSEVGGYHACIFRDTPYVVNSEGIFLIENSHVTKVLDSKDYGFSSRNANKAVLTPFGSYLILNKYMESYPSTGVFKYNLARDGYIRNSHDWTDYQGTNCLISLDAAAGSVGLPGATSTYALKVLCNVAGTTFSFSPKPLVVSSRYMNVQPGDVYTAYFYVKANFSVPVDVQLSFALLDAAGGSLGSIAIQTGTAWTINGSSWVSFGGSFRIPTTGAYVNAAYAYPVWTFTRSSGSFPVGTEYAHIQHITIQPGSYTPNFQFGKDVPPAAQVAYDINHYGSQDVYGVADASSNYVNLVRTFDSSLAPEEFGDQTWFFNMDEGSAHTVSVGDYFSTTITDMITDYDDKLGCPVLYIGVIHDANDREGPHRSIKYMPLNRFFDTNHSYYDEISGSKYYHPKIRIVLSGVSPDGPNYMMKRFRSLEVLGTLPETNLGFGVAVNSDISGDPQGVSFANVSDLEVFDGFSSRVPPFSHRFGLNIRGRSFALLITTPSFEVDTGVTPPTFPMWGPFEISDIRVLYSLTQRGANRIQNPMNP